jgi:hypothetical protein
MRKTLQRRPGFEALESMTLLSGLAGAAVSTAAPNPIHLTGSISGTHTTSTSHAYAGSEFFGLGSWSKVERTVWKGSGSISPLGHVTAYWALFPNVLTLRGKQGGVAVSLAGKRTATGFVGTYTLEARSETGSGNFQMTWTRTAPQGRFTAIFS